MSTGTTESPLDRWRTGLPEGKLELLGGKLVISALVGSRRVLQRIVRREPIPGSGGEE